MIGSICYLALAVIYSTCVAADEKEGAISGVDSMLLFGKLFANICVQTAHVYPVKCVNTHNFPILAISHAERK